MAFQDPVQQERQDFGPTGIRSHAVEREHEHGDIGGGGLDQAADRAIAGDVEVAQGAGNLLGLRFVGGGARVRAVPELVTAAVEGAECHEHQVPGVLCHQAHGQGGKRSGAVEQLCPNSEQRPRGLQAMPFQTGRRRPEFAPDRACKVGRMGAGRRQSIVAGPTRDLDAVERLGCVGLRNVEGDHPAPGPQARARTAGPAASRSAAGSWSSAPGTIADGGTTRDPGDGGRYRRSARASPTTTGRSRPGGDTSRPRAGGADWGRCRSSARSGAARRHPDRSPAAVGAGVAARSPAVL